MQLKSQLSGSRRAEQFALRSDKLKTDIKEQQELQSLRARKSRRAAYAVARSHEPTSTATAARRERLQNCVTTQQHGCSAPARTDLRQRFGAEVHGLKARGQFKRSRWRAWHRLRRPKQRNDDKIANQAKTTAAI